MNQYPATISNFMTFMNMTPDEIRGQNCFQDAIAYLLTFNIPFPEIGFAENVAAQNHPGVQCTFTIGPASIDVSAVLLIFNPLPVVSDLMHAGIIPSENRIRPFIPPSHVSGPIAIDTSDLSKALGPEIAGFSPIRRAVNPAFQGKVDLGTKTPDGKWKLIHSGSPFNRTGVWEAQV